MARTDVKFTRPVRRIFSMLLFLGVVGAVGAVLSKDITEVFNANLQLNGLIAFVFAIGVILAFWQVIRLFSSVNWLEALASRTRGIETIPPPTLLTAMDPMRKASVARGLNSQTARSILDSVDNRIEESRDTLRYISGLLIFLGLLGTFWGLSKTVPAVVETIRSINPEPGDEGAALFQNLMNGLDSQLSGMGTAFASSLLGLAGSLVVGFLELMSGSAHNRFYGELETWLSTMTRISGGADEDGAFANDLAEQLAFVTQQMGALNRIIADGEERRADDGAKIAEAMNAVARIADQAATDRDTLAEAVATQSRILAAVERMAESGGGGGGEGMDAETRRHIRNIDILIAKLIEESAAGRVETADALRREVRAVGRAVNDMTAIIGGAPTSS